MLVLNQTHDSRPEAGISFSADFSANAALSGAGLHDRAACATALDDGLMDEEIRQVLAGRRMVDVFPVRFREPPQACATRVVAEMMVA